MGHRRGARIRKLPLSRCPKGFDFTDSNLAQRNLRKDSSKQLCLFSWNENDAPAKIGVVFQLPLPGI